VGHGHGNAETHQKAKLEGLRVIPMLTLEPVFAIVAESDTGRFSVRADDRTKSYG